VATEAAAKAATAAATEVATTAVATEALVAAPASVATPACVVRPAMTEGPYFLDDMLNRVDVRGEPSDGSVRPGAELALTFRVAQVHPDRCAALPNAIVDIWHCDAAGVYSGFVDRGGLFDTTGQTFLRGQQVTDENGAARFVTVYPGWYPGRAVHIHYKIRTDPATTGAYEFTSQFFFDESLTDQVYQAPPYSEHTGERLRNERDGIFNGGGAGNLLRIEAAGAGYTAAFDIGLEIG
jgi:protocatechuate 3,4-dioxygenase beta subunit